jgi:hypothetical protein
MDHYEKTTDSCYFFHDILQSLNKWIIIHPEFRAAIPKFCFLQ